MDQKLIQKLIDTRQRASALEEELKQLKEEVALLDTQVQEQFVEDGVSSIRTADGVTVYLKLTRRVSSPDMPALCEAMKSEGFDALVKETINNNTLRGWLNEQVDGGMEISPTIAPLLNIYEQWNVGLRGAHHA